MMSGMVSLYLVDGLNIFQVHANARTLISTSGSCVNTLYEHDQTICPESRTVEEISALPIYDHYDLLWQTGRPPLQLS
jgi:hypothetical protein